MNEDYKKYLTRGEFIKVCGITKNTLIWYEKLGLLKPKLVADNGYHYYSLEQFYDIDIILGLKGLDKSLEDCKEFLEYRTGDRFIEILLEQQAAIDRKIAGLRSQKQIIDSTIQDYISLQFRYSPDPKLVDYPQVDLLIYPIKGDTQKEYLQSLHSLFTNFHSCAEVYGISSSMLIGSIVSKEALKARDFLHRSYTSVRLNRPIPHEYCRTIPGGKYLVCYHSGENDQISDTYRKMLRYIEDKKLTIMGDAIEQDFINYLVTNNSDNFKKEIRIPVK